MTNNGTAFGVWLKQHRRAIGLPVKDLAQRVGCSRMTILKIEAGERRPSGQIAGLLAVELGVPSAEHPAFVEFARANLPTGKLPLLVSIDERAPWRTLDVAWQSEASYPSNLPAPPTAFIGREAQIEKATSLLRSPSVRLLTLTGPPGIGKTRLSLRVASRLLADFRDGVFFVPLAPVRDSGLVATAIAQALKLREVPGQPLLDSLKEYLRDKSLLLLLDNFEQVVDAGTLVADLMAAAAQLKVLVTSREALHIYGEYIFSVPPMSLPDDGRQTADDGRQAADMLRYEAIRLFTERAIAADVNFALDDENASAVAEACVLLDGLPLAIELAAARTGTMSSTDIALRLEKRRGEGLSLLSGGPRDLSLRQQTLRNAIDWSYSLLDPEEQTLFRHLSVFTGGCTLEAIEAVSNFEFSILSSQLIQQPIQNSVAALHSLIDKSLVWQDQGVDSSGARFGMLETIREYACELLVERGEEAGIKRRHAEYYLGMAEAAEPQLKGPRQGEWLERLEIEHDNLRAALQWALDREQPDIALRLGAALWRFWLVRGYLSEGRMWLDKAILISHFGLRIADWTNPQLSRVLSNALNGAGNLAYTNGDMEKALMLQERNLALRGEIGDKQGMAGALNNLAVIWRDRGDYERASSLFEQSLALKRELGDRAGLASSLTNLAVVMVRRGNYEAARSSEEESLAIWRELGDRYGVATALTNLGIAALSQGDARSAHDFHRESLAIRRELGDKLGIAVCLSNLASLAFHEEDFESAHTLCGESLQIHRELGDKSGIAHSLHDLGKLLLSTGVYGEAEARLKESLEIRRDLDDRRGIAECLALFARASTGRAPDAGARRAVLLRRASVLLGAAEHLLAAGGFDFYPADREQYERSLEIAQSGLEAAEFRAAKATGEAMSLRDAVAYALAS